MIYRSKVLIGDMYGKLYITNDGSDASMELDMPDNHEMQIDVYTDGCVLNNQVREKRKAGAGAVIVVYVDGLEVASFQHMWMLGNRTNNESEMMAVLFALDKIPTIRNGSSPEITIYTDSNYVYSTFTEWIKYYINNNWHTKSGSLVKNRKLIEFIYKKIVDMNVKIKLIRGHAGNTFNEVADNLAKSAAKNPLNI